MMKIDPQVKSLIVKKMVKGVAFDAKSGSYVVNQKSLSDEEWIELRGEVGKLGVSEDLLRDFVADLSGDLIFSPRIETRWRVEPNEVVVGQHLVLYGVSPQYGRARLELLGLGDGHFLVFSTDRGILRHDDVLVCRTMPWNYNFVADFNVFRNNKRFPDTVSVYRTYPIEKVEFLNPSEVYDWLDRFEEKETEE